MTGDPDLRARIEAQVAARRARRVRRLPSRVRARAGTPPTPGPEPVPQPTPEPIPQPTPEPIPQPTPEPIPQPGPEPIPQPTPDPVPPPPASGSRPRPGPSADAGETQPPKPPPPGTAADEPDSPTPRRRALVRRLLPVAVIVAIAAAAALVLRIFVVAPYYIPSASMEPTLHGCAGCNDDHILIDKVSYRFHAPQQGDIVVFNRPPRADTPDNVLVKRVVGLPGQHLSLRNGFVYIDGKRLQETYLNAAFLRRHCPGPGGPTLPTTGRSQWTVPAGEVFVMGDNRCDSMDSRAFGPIPDSSIIGRAFAIIWPLGRIRLL